MIINFVTTNTLKFEAAKAFFDALDGDYELRQLALDTPEIQDESVETIARESALWATQQSGEPCIKMDVGFSIAALNGFPGPFVKYINDWLTQDDVLTMMNGRDDRTAYFQDALAIAYPDGTTQVFSVKTHGTISQSKVDGETRWPMNLLFVPEGYTRSLGSLSNDEQNIFWSNSNSSWPLLIEYLERTTAR